MNGYRPRVLAAYIVPMVVLSASWAQAATLSVGPSKQYATPCAAAAAAEDNDVIEIDAQGEYGGDVCAIAKNGLTLRGVGGRAKIDAQGKSSGGKAIWVITGHDTTVENIEFSGATVADKNGAGIRQEGDNLTVRSCYFHDNDDGILTNASTQSQIVVEFSEFSNNGFGDGYSHNMYIGNVARFTLRYSYSHDAKVGHLVKSRAAENFILYNRLSGEHGSSSYELDLPNGGTSYVLGNIIEQGASTENPTLFGYALEGTAAGNPGHALYVVNNTFANDRPNGGTFVNVGAMVDAPALLQNNVFYGPGTITNQESAIAQSNYSGTDPKFTASDLLDYTLLSGSPCVDQGTAAASVSAFSLTPEWQYVHPAAARKRSSVGIIDIGAYELGNSDETGPGGGPGSMAAGTGGAAQATGGAMNVQGGEPSISGGSPAQAGGAGMNGDTNGSCACNAAGRLPRGWALLGPCCAALALLGRRLVRACCARGARP